MEKDLIASTLVKLRGNKTQKQVAEDLGISVSALGMYECGLRIPRDTIKVKIAKYYEKSIEEIFFSQVDHL